MSEAWRVALAEPEDVETLAALAAASLPEPWSCDAFRDELVLPAAALWVARPPAPETRPVGYLAARRILEELHILSVAVEAPYRRRAVGSALLTHALKEAWTRGARLAILEVRASNRRALRFYAHHGFQNRARRRRYYSDGQDAVWMSRRLARHGSEAASGQGLVA